MNVEKNLGRLEKRLRRWEDELDKLVAKADLADAEAEVDFQERIDEFRTKHQAAQLKLAGFKATGIEKLDQFRAGIKSSWAGLESTFKALESPSKP
jgi:hypothetical protein